MHGINFHYVLLLFTFPFKYLFTDLKGKADSEKIYSLVDFPNGHKNHSLGQSKSRNRELCLGLPHGLAGAGVPRPSLLPSQVNQQEV